MPNYLTESLPEGRKRASPADWAESAKRFEALAATPRRDSKPARDYGDPAMLLRIAHLCRVMTGEEPTYA